ncbi:LysR family transcriptional regulator [Alicycliphilus denitrificans]|uniref:LysR family transcriptional regulator n=1 Tax=Alicycliphilus denitrificans TaxID=179636 RepID=A0A3R7GZQ2_9BURK|nr:LysR substrate-binding domain-containing protein [Alicycliphilus denitrificans]RKJ95127.1 LysR family transcriptional regulator [Alicycliphilus denitrificans]
MPFNRLHLIRRCDLFTLHLFLSVVEEQQISRAAMREHIAISTATKRIQDLEEIAGAQLLRRTSKGVVPSPAGEVLARYLRQLFSNLNALRDEINAFTEGVRGEVKVAAGRSIIIPFLARELAEYARDYPHVEVIVHELESAQAVQAVAQGEADLGVFEKTPELDLSGVDVVPYREDRLVVLVHRDHPLAERSKVTIEELLSQETLIVSGLMLEEFRMHARRLGQEFRPASQVKSAGVAISLAQAGFGVTIQPECLLRVALFDEVAVVELAEPWAVRSVCVATLRGRTPTSAASALLDVLRAAPGPADPQPHIRQSLG